MGICRFGDACGGRNGAGRHGLSEVAAGFLSLRRVALAAASLFRTFGMRRSLRGSRHLSPCAQVVLLAGTD
jgi:hypothetical protein